MSEATQPLAFRRTAIADGRRSRAADIPILAEDVAAELPDGWAIALRSGPGGHYLNTIDGIRLTLTIADHGLPPLLPGEALSALRQLITAVDEVRSRPYAARHIAALPPQIAVAHWEDHLGRPITVYAFRRHARRGGLGMSSVFPLAGLAGAKVALALAGAAVVIAGVVTLPPPGNVTSLTPGRPETSVVREHYVAPAPARDADASAPEPTQPIRDPADAPTVTPTAYAGQLPASPTVTPTPGPVAVPSVVPTVVTPTVLPTALALASP